MGIFFYKVALSEQDFEYKDSSKYDGIFYVGYKEINDDKYISLMYLTKSTEQYLLNIVVCPHETWISNHSLSEYIVDKSNTIPFLKRSRNDGRYYYYKINCCGETSKIFLKCGHINQKFMPSIDVGYSWGLTVKENLLHSKSSFTFNFEYQDLTINSENNLAYNELGSLLHPSLVVYYVMPPSDNGFGFYSTVIGRYKNDSKLYFGQGIFVLFLNEYKTLDKEVRDMAAKLRTDNHIVTGYSFNIRPQFLVPNIETTLRLTVNGVVQKFKTAKNSESMDTYTVDVRGMENGQVGCHAVPDNITHPGFKDFYEKSYPTYLYIFDENKDEPIPVNDTKSLVSNSTYVCFPDLKDRDDENFLKLAKKYIKIKKFKIHLIESYDSVRSTGLDKSTHSDKLTHSNESVDSSKSNDSTKSKSTIWIITGVSVGVLLIITLILLAGLIFYRKRLVKKKGIKNSLSSGKSSSASKSSNTIKSEYYVAGIQNKAGNGGPKNIMNKKIVSNENLKISSQNVKRSKEVRSYEVQNK
uniref:Uncharacterized protein n=1 Tax=Strongyloides papillosus TaxID=174720 RepID=A0A0N5BZV8_STREA